MTFVGSWDRSGACEPPPQADSESEPTRRAAATRTGRRMAVAFLATDSGGPAGGPLSESHAEHVVGTQG